MATTKNKKYQAVPAEAVPTNNYGNQATAYTDSYGNQVLASDANANRYRAIQHNGTGNVQAPNAGQSNANQYGPFAYWSIAGGDPMSVGTQGGVGGGNSTAPTGTPTPPGPEDDGDDGDRGRGGSGGSGGAPAAAPAAAQQARLGRGDVSVEPYGPFNGPGGYVPEADPYYVQAMQALQAAQAQMPAFDNPYGGELQDLYQQIRGRSPFQYDLDADMLYQQYRDQYMRQGQQAMRDTMGQAAGLTGGYGSSYAQNAGQQAYNSYLQQLNERIPELEERAYQRWLGEGDQLTQQYAMAKDLSDTGYQQYRDQMSDYYRDVDLAQGQEQLAWNRGYQLNDEDWNRAVQDYQLNRQANEDIYSRQQDEKANLLQLMQMGYTPTEEDLRASGMTSAEADTWAAYIARQNAGSGGGGGGSGNGPTPEEWSDYLYDQIRAGKIKYNEYGAYMASMFPDYLQQQVSQEEERKRRLQGSAELLGYT